MAGLIKSAEANGVRAFTPSLPVPSQSREVPEPDPALARLEAEVVRLQALMQTRDQQIDALQRRIDEARLEGEQEGRRIALDEIEDDRTALLQCLETSLGDALERFSRQLISMERLAILVAEASLDKLLAEPEHYHALCQKAISAQVARIESTSIVEILVPVADFPSEAELTGLSRICGIELGRITGTSALLPGECRIRLTLGEIDVGLRQQWNRLSALLEDIADQEVL